MVRYIFILIGMFVVVEASACENLGNSRTGCASNVLGVQTESGTLVELTVSTINWYEGHVCEGIRVVQFGGTDLEKQAALSIGMAAYLSNQGPVSFRCQTKVSSSTCRCTNIALGESKRD